MSEWLNKNMILLNLMVVAVVCICGAFGIKSTAGYAIAFIMGGAMAVISIIAAQHGKRNLFGAIIWTLLAVYSGLMLVR